MKQLRTWVGRAAIAPITIMAIGASCIGTPPPPPTLGYGAPYHGTGEGIYVKDSRGDWDITEGHHKITSEQALEASGDPEYEARRQIAKDYNVQLYREGLEHRTRGHHMMEAGAVMAVVGLIVQFVVAPKLQDEKIEPAKMDGTPESRTYTTGFAAGATVNLGFGLFALGVGGITYGYLGGRRTPPYHVWKTPGPLDRPAYVRQQTEPYNEKIGAPSIPDEDGQQVPGKGLRPPPGVKPPPRMPVMRGGRR